MTRIARLIGVSCSVPVLLLGIAWAGARAPAPEAGGPHVEHQLVTIGDFKFESGGAGVSKIGR